MSVDVMYKYRRDANCKRRNLAEPKDIPTFGASKLIVSASLPFWLSTDFFVLIFFSWAIRVQVADAIDFDARLVQASPLSLTTALGWEKRMDSMVTPLR